MPIRRDHYLGLDYEPIEAILGRIASPTNPHNSEHPIMDLDIIERTAQAELDAERVRHAASMLKTKLAQIAGSRRVTANLELELAALKLELAAE